MIVVADHFIGSSIARAPSAGCTATIRTVAVEVGSGALCYIYPQAQATSLSIDGCFGPRYASSFLEATERTNMKLGGFAFNALPLRSTAPVKNATEYWRRAHASSLFRWLRIRFRQSLSVDLVHATELCRLFNRKSGEDLRKMTENQANQQLDQEHRLHVRYSLQLEGHRSRYLFSR